MATIVQYLAIGAIYGLIIWIGAPLMGHLPGDPSLK